MQEFIKVAFRPKVDHNIDWQCSLRQGEHDFEFDGLKDLKEIDEIMELSHAKSSRNESLCSNKSMVGQNTLTSIRPASIVKECGEDGSGIGNKSIAIDRASTQPRDFLSHISCTNQIGSKFRNKDVPYEKRRTMYDRKFLNDEEDIPIEKRRVNLIHDLGKIQNSYKPNLTHQTIGNFETIGKDSVDLGRTQCSPVVWSKFLYAKRLPQIAPQFMSKPKIYRTRNYQC